MARFVRAGRKSKTRDVLKETRNMITANSEPLHTKGERIGRFASPHAMRVMDDIEKFIEQQKISSTDEISCQFHLSNTMTCAYLRELRSDGRIRAAGKHGRRSRSRCWEIGEDPEFLAAEAVPKKQSIVKEWPLNNRRDPLHFYLFGYRGIAESVLKAAGVIRHCACCQSLQGEPHSPGCNLAIGVAA